MYRGGYNGAPESYRNIPPTGVPILSPRGNRPVAEIPIQHFNNQPPHPHMYYPAQTPQMPIQPPQYQQIPQLPRPGLLSPPQLISNDKLSLSRRRGFDQAPTYEKFGGDMDISRSRSGSPKRAHRDRSPLKSFDDVRDGILWHDDNYYNFLVYWVEKFDGERRGHRDDETKKLVDLITKASRIEREKINLPPEYSKSDRDRLVHCDLTISTLPSSIFFGSGYGSRSKSAKNAAAKDLIDKCHRIGVISSELHTAIGDRYQFDTKKYSKEINKSLESIKLLRRKISAAKLPRDIISQRQIDPDIINKFKVLLREVMMEIYYVDSAKPPAKVEKMPAIVKVVKNGPVVPLSPEKLIAMKEEQLKKKLELELEAKRKQMEEEIRAQIVEEERAKIREEIEREKRFEMLLIQQQQYEKEKEMKEREKALLEQQKKELYLQQQKDVEDELNRMVVQLENKLLEFKDKGMTSVLELIFSSSAFKTIASMAESSNKMTNDDKKQLIIDLKALLECAALSVNSLNGTHSNTSSSYQSSSSYGMGDNSSNSTSAYSSYAKQIEEQNRAGFPLKSASDLRSSGQSSSRQTTSNSSSSKQSSSSRPSSSASNKRQPQQKESITQQEPVNRVRVGGVSIRSYNSIEQRRLTTGTKVIAQDMKNGNWQVGTIMSINNNRATIAVGSSTWKKDLSDLYTEDDNKF